MVRITGNDSLWDGTSTVGYTQASISGFDEPFHRVTRKLVQGDMVWMLNFQKKIAHPCIVVDEYWFPDDDLGYKVLVRGVVKNIPECTLWEKK